MTTTVVHCNELLPTPLLQTPHGHLMEALVHNIQTTDA